MRSLVVVTAVVLAQACGSVANCPPEVDLQGDHDNCGACGHACAAGETCGDGVCVSCPADQTVCGSTCAALDSDAMNCSACGIACNTGEACIASQCVVPCDATKLAPSSIADPWGIAWDTDQRDPASLNTALATCKTFGGRLPTPTEIYRASAAQSGTVGQSFDTSYLWTPAPDDKLDQTVARLSDGGTSTQPATSSQPYRCVCPAVLPRSFTGAHCLGKPGSECFAVGGYHFDAADRPALRRSAAVWECTNDRAHLADLPALAEAIRAGLPGSNRFVATADDSDNHQSTQVRWTSATTPLAGNVTAIDLRTPAPFRCAAPAAAQSPNPNAVAGQFVGPLSRYKSETADNAPAAWAAAHDVCTSRGGHLPRATELVELILQGLPNGSNKALWSADQVGYDSTQFQVIANNWSGLDPRHSYGFGGTDASVAAVYKTTASAPFRCIYYPLDAAYATPTACKGGCFTLALPGDPAPTLWFDSADRAALTLTEALADCASAGGHLPSERDLTEAIRAGLPGGAGGAVYVHTSDLGRGMNMIVRWAGTGNAMYGDQYATSMTWAAITAVHPYRCMWTNELR